MTTPDLPTSHPAEDPREPDEATLDVLLDDAFARALARPDVEGPASQGLRARLQARTAASRAEEAPMRTARLRRLPRETLAPGLESQTLYAAPAGRPTRPGEPLRARLLVLAPGARLRAEDAGPVAPQQARHREWLVLSGRLEPLSPEDAATTPSLGPQDYHAVPAGHATPSWVAPAGARVFLRESLFDAPGQQPLTVRDAEAGWPEYAPGIRRRVLWSHGDEAALLWQTDPGASVPTHRHGHDEECLMVRGDLFLDDVLLREGDYQLAPAGTGHRVTETDTGVVIYAHGDLDLQFTG